MLISGKNVILLLVSNVNLQHNARRYWFETLTYFTQWTPR